MDKQIKDIRQKLRLTQEEFAKKLGVTAVTISKYENGVMKWTGHSDYESMKPYIAIVDKLKRQEMNKFNI